MELHFSAKNVVAVNEFFDPDVDIYYLVWKALRYVRVHNIFVWFFFSSIGQFQEESESTSKVKEGKKYSDNVKQG